MSRNEEKCGDCKFFGAVEGEYFGFCRRYPPTPMGDAARDAFPEVSQDAWCGEFVIDDSLLMLRADINPIRMADNAAAGAVTGVAHASAAEAVQGDTDVAGVVS